MTARRCTYLRHLKQRKHALLHTGAARAGKQHDRQSLFSGILEQTGQLFAHDRTHGCHHEMTVHHTERSFHTADLADTGLDCIRHADLFGKLLCLVRITREVNRVCGCKIAVQLLEGILIRDLTDAGAGQQTAVATAVRAHIQIFAVGVGLQLCAATLAGDDLVGGLFLLRFEFHGGLARFLEQVDQTHTYSLPIHLRSIADKRKSRHFIDRNRHLRLN